MQVCLPIHPAGAGHLAPLLRNSRSQQKFDFTLVNNLIRQIVSFSSPEEIRQTKFPQASLSFFFMDFAVSEKLPYIERNSHDRRSAPGR